VTRWRGQPPIFGYFARNKHSSSPVAELAGWWVVAGGWLVVWLAGGWLAGGWSLVTGCWLLVTGCWVWIIGFDCDTFVLIHVH